MKKLLATAKNMDALLEAVPDLLNPKALLSVLVTVNKWWVLACMGWSGLGRVHRYGRKRRASDLLKPAQPRRCSQ